jgi:CHAT domain-containing protein
VLATLWPANDAATSVLMADFYRRWTEGKGLRKIDALRQAQTAMLHGDHPHPYFWAPFLLMGNWQ